MLKKNNKSVDFAKRVDTVNILYNDNYVDNPQDDDWSGLCSTVIDCSPLEKDKDKNGK